MENKKGFVIVVFIILFATVLTADARPISYFDDIKTKYQDYEGVWHYFTNENLAQYPLYTVVDNGNNYTITRWGTSINIPKRTWINYNFYPERIVPVVTIQNYSQINQLATKVNSTVWYLTVPWSASQVKSVTDDLIDMGVFKRTTKIQVTDSNTTPNNYQVLPKVVGGNIRIYFNPQTYSNVVYPLILTEQTIIIDNATTSGYNSSNITTNGYWSAYGGGSIGTPLNETIHTNLSLYADCEATSGNILWGINRYGRFPNSSIQGTFIGNTTLNYTAGQSWGSACSFDGSDDYYRIEGNSEFQFSGDFNISFSIVPQGTQSGLKMFLSNSNNHVSLVNGWSIYRDDTNKLFVRSGSGIVFNIDYQFYAGTKYDISVSRSGTGTNNVNLTINNTLIAQASNNDVWGGTNPLGIGAMIKADTTSIYLYNGSIDGVVVSSGNSNIKQYAASYYLNISNQTASAGKIISAVRFNAPYLNSLNNTANISVRQNGTSSWTQVSTNYQNWTWVNFSGWARTDILFEGFGNGSARMFLVSGEIDETGNTPTITSWGNNYTNDNSTTITIPKYTTVIFNVTSNLVSANWTWVSGIDTIDGNGTVNSNGTNYFDTMGAYTVWVYGTNGIGNSNTISWNVNVLGACCFNLSGYVRNILELPLQNARIDLNNSNHAFTNSTGYYNFTNITENDYVILARAIGYRNNTNNTNINSNTTINFTMKEKTTGVVQAPGFEGTIVLFILSVLIYIRKRKIW